MGFMDRFLQEPLYHFAGLGGENLRHYEAGNAEHWLSFHRGRQKSINSEHDFLGGYSRILAKSRGAICEYTGPKKPPIRRFGNRESGIKKPLLSDFLVCRFWARGNHHSRE
jgi:hypothetical protein